MSFTGDRLLYDDSVQLFDMSISVHSFILVMDGLP